MLIARSRLYLTSDEVSASPLENFRFGLSLQVNVCGSVYSQDSAASPCGVFSPAGIVSSVWYMLYSSVDEPWSYEPAGSRAVTESVVPIVMASPLESDAPEPLPPSSSRFEPQAASERSRIAAPPAAIAFLEFPTLIRMLLPSRLHLWSGVTPGTLVRQPLDVSKGRSRHDYRSNARMTAGHGQDVPLTRDFNVAMSTSTSVATSTREGVSGTSTWLGTTSTRQPAASAEAAPVGESSI